MERYTVKKANGWNANIAGPYIVVNDTGIVVCDNIPDKEGADYIAHSLNAQDRISVSDLQLV